MIVCECRITYEAGDWTCQRPLIHKCAMCFASYELYKALKAIVEAPYGVAIGDLENAKAAVANAEKGCCPVCFGDKDGHTHEAPCKHGDVESEARPVCQDCGKVIGS